MKKLFAAVAVLVMMGCAVSLFGCNDTNDTSADVVITESKYVAYVNEIYANTGSYLDKTITLEGIFEKYSDGNYWVYRNGPGCCGTDAMCGFILQGIAPDKRPHNKDWVQITGIFKYDSAIRYPYLRVMDFQIKNDARGKETVSNSVL